jgi:hypothetical protein
MAAFAWLVRNKAGSFAEVGEGFSKVLTSQGRAQLRESS